MEDLKRASVDTATLRDAVAVLAKNVSIEGVTELLCDHWPSVAGRRRSPIG